MEILETFFKQRNSSKSTQTTYTRSAKYYQKLTGHTISELLEIADDEEYNNIRWKNTKTRRWLIEYRELLYGKYNVSTAQLYLTAIMTIYRHFEITIPPLPYYSTKRAKHTPPINYTDLPDRAILTECINIASPLVKSIILFMSSSGISRIDLLNLKISDYLEATKDYHNHPDSVKYAIRDMKDESIVPTFYLSRQKTGQDYFTFCSHEAVKAINSYLLTRQEVLTQDKRLFKVNERYLNMIFERLNHHFQLGRVGIYNRLRPHMLRKYHASQLAEAGMSTENINLLQGRKVHGVAHESYIRVNPETLREEYIQALPYIVVEETEQYKTELESIREENKVYKENIEALWEEINSMSSRQDAWETLQKEE